MCDATEHAGRPSLKGRSQDMPSVETTPQVGSTLPTESPRGPHRFFLWKGWMPFHEAYYLYLRE